MKLADVGHGIEVFLGGRKVGTLARSREGLIAFQYDGDWLADGYSINPYSLPLTSELFVPQWQPFDGLFGASTLPVARTMSSSPARVPCVIS